MDKILPDSVLKIITKARNHQQSIVLATGVFDLLHQEHRRFLHQAKAAGNILIVGVETDCRVKALKGANRPLQNQAQRLQQVAALADVDAAFILPENLEEISVQRQLIRSSQANILAVSSHTPFLARKKQILAEFNAKLLVVHQQNPKVSTTQLLSNTKK